MIKLRRGRPKRLILDIGASAIRLCELSQTKTGLQLSKYFHREILNDPAIDEETKKKQRREALKAILKEARVRNRKSLLCVPGRSVFTRTRTLPPVPQYKVAQIVRYEIQQQIPFGLDQIALDYQILNRTEAGSYDVMMVAIKVDVVDKHLEVLKETKCRVDSVDVSPIAAYNWFKHAGEFGTEGECVALLDIGASSTDIVIERGNQFRFTRPLNIGGDDVTKAISTTFNVSYADAERLKRERGFAPTGDPKVDGRAGECIGQVLSRLVNEVSRSFGYFRSLPGGGTVDRVIVTGGAAKLRNLIPYLQRHLGMEVRIARPLAGLTVGPNAQAANEHADQAGVALGMALRCVEPVTIEVNLIPPQVIEAAHRKEQALFWVLSLVALGLIAASVIPTRANQDKQVREDITKLEAVLEKYDPELVAQPATAASFKEQELQTQQARVTELTRQIEKLSNAYGVGQNWLNDLKLLNDLRPEGGKIWFSSVETSVITPAGQGASAAAAAGPRGGMRGFGGGVAGAGSSGGMDFISTGFGSLGPQRSESGLGRGGRMGSGAGMGPTMGPDPGAMDDPTKAPAPPVPNGYKIMGYAMDADSLILFINRLKECPRFSAPSGKVHFNEATVEEVYITEIDNVPTIAQPITATTSAADGEGGRGRERRGLGAGASLGGGGGYSTGGRGPSSAPIGGFQKGESVFRFRVDLEFMPPPAPPQPAARPMGAPGMPQLPFGKGALTGAPDGKDADATPALKGPMRKGGRRGRE